MYKLLLKSKEKKWLTTMSNLTVQEVNGVEFYVSNDGKDAGVSVRGLARLCAVSPGGMSDLLRGIEDVTFTKQPPKQLEHLRGASFGCSLEGVKLVGAEVAARIIEYYAFESKAKNETALYSFRKFAVMGFESWVKQVVGYAEAASENKLLSAMQELMSEMKELRADVKSLRDFKVATVELPGLQQQFDGYANQAKALDSAPFTLRQWVETKGIVPTKSFMCSLGRMVADLYKVNTQQPLKTRRADHMGQKGKGPVTVYTAADLPMLEAALQKAIK